MKYHLIFLLLAPLSSSALFRDCFKSQVQIDRERLEELAEITQSNHKQTITITVI